MGQQGSYGMGSRTLQLTDTLSGVVTGVSSDVPVSSVSTLILAQLGIIGVTGGGTGATTAAQARTNLGITTGNLGAVDLTTAQTISGVKSFSVAQNIDYLPNLIFGASMVRVTAAGGMGSTNTAIRYFNTVLQNQGADITYTSDTVHGDSFTVNANGVYAISYVDQFATAAHFGVSVNSTQLSTSLNSVTLAFILAAVTNAASNYAGSCSTTVWLGSGSVLRAHGTTGTTTGTNTALCQFTITRVA